MSRDLSRDIHRISFPSVNLYYIREDIARRLEEEASIGVRKLLEELRVMSPASY